MRHVIYGLIAGLTAILTFTAILTVDTVHTRQKELDDALDLSCSEVMGDTYDSLDYLTMTEEEFLDQFTELMKDKICVGGASRDSNLELQVDVAALDLENGLFSVKVTEYFTYPDGVRGSVSARKTAVYEESVYGA